MAPLLMFPLVFVVGIGSDISLFNSNLGTQGMVVEVIAGMIVAAAWVLAVIAMRNITRIWFYILLAGYAVFVIGIFALSLSFVATDYLGLVAVAVALWSYWKISAVQKVLPTST